MSPDESLRKACLEVASRVEQNQSMVLRAASAFELFVKNGATGQAAPQPQVQHARAIERFDEAQAVLTGARWTQSQADSLMVLIQQGVAHIAPKGGL